MVSISLSARHRSELDASAISLEQIEFRGYRTIDDPKDFPKEWAGCLHLLPALCIPIRDTSGEIRVHRLKPDNPRTDSRGKDIKYESPKGSRPFVDVPLAMTTPIATTAGPLPLTEVPNVPLWITEGEKKVDSLLTAGARAVVGVSGVFAWQGNHGQALPEWKDFVFRGKNREMNDLSRIVIMAFDSDVMGRADLRSGLVTFAEYLDYRGATVRYCLMPNRPDGSKCGVDDFFVSGHTMADLEALVVDSLPEVEEVWEEPLTLDDPYGPPLPLDALPLLLQDLVTETEAQLQVPPDYPFCATTGAISAAAGGKYEIVYQPSDWHVAINSQSVMVGDPSDGKSPVLGALVFPQITTWENAKREVLRPVIEAWQSTERILRRQLDAAEKSHGKPNKNGHITDSTAIRDAALLELREHLEKKQVYPDIFGSNATPEAVEKKLHEQRGAYAILSAESPFLSNAIGGRYSDAPNLEVILQGWEGDHLSNERSGREEDFEVARAYLTILCCVQPSVLRRAGREEDTIGRGVAARLLPVIPKSRADERTIDGRAAIAEQTMSAWTEVLDRLLNTERGEFPRQLVLSAEAERIFAPWYNSIAPRMRNQSAAMKGWLGKMAAQALKVAGQFHVVENQSPENIPISIETMQKAIQVAEYFLGHAEVMIGMMMDRRAGEPSEARQVLEIIRLLVGDDGRTTKRELHRKLRGRAAFQRTDDLNAPLSLLQETHWIRLDRKPLDKHKSSGVGRPADLITLNPCARDKSLETHGQNGQNPSRSGGETLSVQFVHASLDPPLNVSHLADRLSEPLPPTGTDGEWSIEL